MSNCFVALLVGVVFAASAISTASAGTVAGRASVIDGNTLLIDGERIRILDIDAPELGQPCFLRDGGNAWPCGAQAARALADLIAQYPVTCETMGTDNAGRWLAHCDVATVSVATWMASNGWALPNQDCRCEEVRAWTAFAQGKKAGIWGSDFMMPWEWRKVN